MSGATFRLSKISDLHEDPSNARRHGSLNKAAVRASLAEFGQVEALVVEAGTGRVIGGNCRLQELREMGKTEAWIAEVDIHGMDASRLGLALNRTAELAEWDDVALEELLETLNGEGVELGELGWSEEELSSYLDIRDPWDGGVLGGGDPRPDPSDRAGSTPMSRIGTTVGNDVRLLLGDLEVFVDKEVFDGWAKSRQEKAESDDCPLRDEARRWLENAFRS